MDAARNPGFTTTRDQMFAEYAKEGGLFGCSTRPYVSIATIVFDIVSPSPAAPNAVMAHAVAKQKQQIQWFYFGVGDAIEIGSSATPIQKKATEADTNMSKGKKTNGVEDFVIEGVSASCQGMRILYADADLPATITGGDQTALGAYKGKFKMVDPSALATPPEYGSPVNLEEVFFEAICAKLSARLVWDRKGFIPIGTLDQFPEGAARSLIRAHGDPRTDNRYKIPEGAAFRRVDKTDGDFSVEGQLEDSVVIPVSLVALGGDDTPLIVPEQIYVDIRLRLHGLGFGRPGANTQG